MSSAIQVTQKMKKRSPLAVVLLSLVTFGIYDLYWLVVTKKILNEKTRHHTPTIWLLVVPYIILSVGYGMLFVGSIIDAAHTSSSSGSGSTSVTSSGEQLNQKGQRRPVQYVHICDTVNGDEYVSQGSPKCLDGDTYKNDYDASVAGTVFSSPCKTTSGQLRYVYISTNESCPEGTRLVFYNSLYGGSSYAAGNNFATANTDSSASNDQVPHGSMYLWSIGLIILGFITTFFAGIYWFFQFSKAINEYTRGKMSTAVTFLILWLIHLIGVALIQDTFNEMGEAGAVGFGTVPGPITPAMASPMTGGAPGTATPTAQQPPQFNNLQPLPAQPVQPTQPVVSPSSPEPQAMTQPVANNDESSPVTHPSPQPDKPDNHTDAPDSDHFSHTI